MIAGGVGLAGGAAFLLFKGKGKDGADPASKDPTGAAAPGAATGAATGAGAPGPTAATPTTAAAPGTAGAAVGGTGGLAGKGQQVGPYTVIDDGTGTKIVFETATEQPVGILDAQGNMTPITVDAQGNVSIAEQAPAAGTAANAAGTAAGLATGPGAGTATGTTAGTEQAMLGPAEFNVIAKDLFANASNGAVGAATSDSMAGVANIAPNANVQAGAVAPTGQGAATTTTAPVATNGLTSTAAPAATAGQVTTSQVGEFTVVDDGGGTKLILDTATQQPVGMMDPSGAVVPIGLDANGKIQVTGAPISGLPAGAATATSPATVTSPATITSPVGAQAPAFGS